MKLAVLALVALPSLPLAACVAEPEETSTTAQPVIHCPAWGCGENSPVMGPYEFHELNTDGVLNTQEIQVLNFQKGTTLYRPEVDGAKLIAYDGDGNKLVGADLAGGYFNLKTKTGVFKLDILRVTPDTATDAVGYWVGDQTVRNESYQLVYEFPGDPKQVSLCNSTPSRTVADNPGHFWDKPYEALLFTGDRYDANLKTVTASTYGSTVGWFNVACAGSAIAKLHLNRHTTAGSPGPGLVTTTWQQRQALLKMFVSDICGTGMAFTKKGTPLHWANTLGWSQLTGAEWAHESLWTENGAMCLDTHRLGTLYLQDIKDTCTRVACSPRFGGWYLTSAVPLAVP